MIPQNLSIASRAFEGLFIPEQIPHRSPRLRDVRVSATEASFLRPSRLNGSLNNSRRSKSQPALSLHSMRPPSLFLRTLVLTIAASATIFAKSDETYIVRRLFISDTEAHALEMPDKGNDAVVVDRVQFLASHDFAVIAQKFIGRRIDNALLNDLAAAISDYARKQDRLVSNLQVPTQNVKSGILRLAVSVGRFSDIQVRGNRWFSSKLIEERLGVRPGDEIRISALDQAVSWTNTNPFRQVKVLVNQVTNQPGKNDLIIGVRDRFPVRLIASYDDSGNDVLGNRHYTAGLQFGNLWGLDHQAAYQFVTTDSLQTYQAHVLQYRIPLPWRHFIEFNGSYVRARPTFERGLFSQDAINDAASLRYVVPLRTGNDPAEWFVETDAKETNNNLEFGGTRVLSTKVDTFQVASGFTAVRHDKLGAWLTGATVFFSPGHLNSRNDTVAYQAVRYGSSPRYVYANLSLQRTIEFHQGWQLFSRAVGQISGGNLVPNEELTIGGAATVRGFNTNIFAGDQGFVFSNDLQTPVIKTKLALRGKPIEPLETRFAMFYDAAQVEFKHPYAFDPKMKPMASAGVGIRMSVSSNFSFNFDYGWQITRLPYAHTDHCRGHVKVVLAY